MFKQSLLSVTLFVFMSAAFATDIPCGKDAANPDAECTGKDTVCVLAKDPKVCAPKQEKGAACMRDKVCLSNKCVGADKDKKIKGKCE